MAAKTYAVLLRGINVGGKNKLPMPALRTLLEDAGYDGVATYIQSGNVVLRSSLAEGALTRAVEKQIAEEFSLAIRVVVRTHAELERIAGANPFLAGSGEATGMHVVFLDSAPEAAAIATLDPDRSPGDEFRVSGKRDLSHVPERLGPVEADARLPRTPSWRHRHRAQLEHTAQAGRADGTRIERLRPPTRSETSSKPSRWSRLAAAADR